MHYEFFASFIRNLLRILLLFSLILNLIYYLLTLFDCYSAAFISNIFYMCSFSFVWGDTFQKFLVKCLWGGTVVL